MARQNLGDWLKLSAKGEDIGVVVGADIVALRQVPIQAADHPTQEYGLSPTQVEEAGKKIEALIKRERRAKTVKEFKGDWHEMRG